MTNGEKIKAMFPSMEVGFITDLQVGIYFVKNQHSATVFSLDWWNAEYKEPTTKNDLGVDCISRQDVLSEIIRFSTEEGSSVECQQLYCDVNNMPSVTPQEPKIIPIAEIKYDEDKLKELVNNAVLTVTSQEPVIDKIRAEILEDCGYSKDYVGAFTYSTIKVETVLQILDKYKVESEDKEQQ